ncbi:MAG TPA: hypothetical protein VNE21_05320, partial [Mycobacteriales bacterium]|nr:hypothetical protein [Mycobacteriales bacterium]
LPGADGHRAPGHWPGRSRAAGPPRSGLTGAAAPGDAADAAKWIRSRTLGAACRGFSLPYGSTT